MDNQADKNKGNEKHPHHHHLHHTDGNHSQHKSAADKDDIDDTDKYLAMEQPGVTFTKERDVTANSDQDDYGSDDTKEWSEEGGNSKNSDAFNQDDYILEDNIDLDEDQNQSISSDDDDFEESNERY